jgi:type I restriction enzyme S subunit|tara:strand:+ start:2820 stop:4523 length:1704 start_codon:yes stop_codon:yes gene_type:complete
MINVLIEHIDIWVTAQTTKISGRVNGANNHSPYGIRKLRELILKLAVRGKLVPQDPADEPASVLLEKIAEEKERLINRSKIKKQKSLIEIQDDEKQLELPQGWAYTRYGDLFSLRKGKIPKTLSGENIGLPYLDIEALDRDNILRYTDDKKCPLSTDEDILVVCDGSRSGLVLNGKNGVVGSTLAVIDTPKSIQSYVKLLFQEAFQRLNTSMKGAAIPHLDTKNLIVDVIGLPPQNEQHRIVVKVNELMGLCDQLEQQQTDSDATHQTLVETLLATLTNSTDQNDFAEAWQRIANHLDNLFTTENRIDQLRQTILHLAVMGKLVPQEPNDEPANVLLQKIGREKARLVEEEGLRTTAKIEIDPREEYIHRQAGWEYCRLGNLAKFVDYRGRTPMKIESGVPLITAKNVRSGFISREPQEFISENEYEVWMTRGFPKVGDILFTTEAPLGNVALVDIEEIFALAQRVICFQLHEPDTAPFLKVVMMSRPFQEQLTHLATGMTATGIKSAKLKEIPVPIPPLAEQHRIVAKVDRLMALCDTLKSRLNEIQATQVQLADAVVEQVTLLRK